ncbi:patatin-like protein 3 [Salvia divinorum]|uniref:Patatin-like protein 3 n=1 Tax=Salvia divinorum TaxID=28513 RepID=A0ABD1H462_SALDI
MAAVYPNMLQDKLTNEIFSILENKFLFGTKPCNTFTNDNGKVRILSMDAADAILAANALVYLQSILRAKSANPSAHIADFFDVVAGSGAGGVLAALLFTRGKDGAPLMTADQSLTFLLDHHRTFTRRRPLFGRSTSKLLKKVFGDLTLKDTLRKGVLIPCYDLKSGAPFLFSRADALEMDGCDFRIAGLCEATLADAAVQLKSVDGRSRIVAVGGRVGMSNPTAAAITHVLNNKHEFPLCSSIQDLLVVSLGGAADVAAQGFADMVDQAVSMAFGEDRRSNYVRIQGLVNGEKKRAMAERILGEKNVESVLFKGKKMVESTNMERMEMLGGELIKEQERRKNAILPTVLLSSPRSSSASTLSSN